MVVTVRGTFHFRQKLPMDSPIIEDHIKYEAEEAEQLTDNVWYVFDINNIKSGAEFHFNLFLLCGE